MSLRGGKIIGIGTENCISQLQSSEVIRMDMLFLHNRPRDQSIVKQLLGNQFRFHVTVYDVLPEEQFKTIFPEAHVDLLQCYRERQKDKDRYSQGYIYFSQSPYMAPIQSLSYEDGQFLRDSLLIMHSLKVIHGDLHKGNILRFQGKPVIIDFDGAEVNPSEFNVFKEKDKTQLEEVIHYYSKKYLLSVSNISIVVSIKHKSNVLIVQDSFGKTYETREENLIRDD
jgi:thiamine kinase-like enzyme